MSTCYLDAPVSGGEPGARDGTLAIFAGGAAEDSRGPRRSSGRWPRHALGPAGSGQLTKLARCGAGIPATLSRPSSRCVLLRRESGVLD